MILVFIEGVMTLLVVAIVMYALKHAVFATFSILHSVAVVGRERRTPDCNGVRVVDSGDLSTPLQIATSIVSASNLDAYTALSPAWGEPDASGEGEGAHRYR